MERIPALEDAISKKNMVGVYSVFYTIAHGDPNFSTGKFRSVLNYVKMQNLEGFMQVFDGEEFETEEQWDEDYWALIASSLIDNFCEERINHLEEIGKKLYPIRKPKSSQSTGQNTSHYTSRNTSQNANQNRSFVDGSSMGGMKGASGSKARELTPEERRRMAQLEQRKKVRTQVGDFITMILNGGPRR